MIYQKREIGWKGNFNMKWKMFFKAQQEVIDGEGTLGYKLGPDDTIVKVEQVVDILTVGSYHCILYVTDNTALAAKVKDFPEFMGFSYIDMVFRIAQGLSNVTLSDVEYLTGAHWYLNGEWHFSNVKDWKAAGSPSAVWFGKFREIMGIDLE